ncbi:MAG TPA: hypothetical protein PLA51_00845 [Spirochaetota bacterium]|nr:hypothetical protein [Spirochaetota bacterium]HPD78671.1 hypothetical protein [Spirochaetota bacterium]HRS61895.1 hypothetical protein [Spirochaetota bacterium]HRU64386.1 hypothetical protein [Spirochaetota bacterium]
MVLDLKNIKLPEKLNLYLKKAMAFSQHIYIQYIKPFDILNLSYFPFIGWFVPMILNRDDFDKYHAKQGFVLAVFFTFTCSFLYFFKYFVPERADIVQLVVILLIYVLYIIYFTICYLGTKMILRREIGEFAYIDKYVKMLTLKIDI